MDKFVLVGPDTAVRIALPVDAATASKQDTGNASLAAIAADVKPLSGAGTSGTLALAIADTWYAVPSTVPVSDYLLSVTKENAAGQLRWSFSNAAAPSATNGNKFNSEDIIAELAAGEVIYVASDNAGDDVNWTTKII